MKAFIRSKRKKIKLIGKPHLGHYTVFPIETEKNNAPISEPRILSLGEAIKEIRLKRGMTQKDLGVALGFSENTANIRISQYESNRRTPKADLLQQMQVILNCEFHQKHYVEYSIF